MGIDRQAEGDQLRRRTDPGHEVRTAVAAGVIGIITACSSAGTASPSGAIPSGAAPASAALAGATPSVAEDCPVIDLRTPTGVRVDLNGTWYANDDAYYSFLQIGNCVWATATTRLYVITLRGTVMTDFTVPVEFAYVAYRPHAPGEARVHGTATLLIEFETTADGEVIGLRKVLSEVYSPYAMGVTQWSRVSEPPPLFPPPTPGS